MVKYMLLISKMITERIKKVLFYIIHGDQRGSMSGRYSIEIIRTVEDALEQMFREENDNIILLLDQEKAYDRTERPWIFKVLKKFDFGDRITSKFASRRAKKSINRKS